MFIVAVGFIGGFLLGGTLCEVVGQGSKTRSQSMAERGFVATVGDHNVTLEEYRAALAYVTDKYKNENQLRDLSSDDYTEIENQAWNFLISELTWQRLLKDARVKTSEEEIIEIMQANPPEDMRGNPELLNEQGEFDREKYISVMNNPQNRDYFVRYFRELAEMLPKEKLRIDIVNTVRVTGPEANRAVREAASRWTITSLYFGPKVLGERAEPTEEEARVWYRANLDEFRTKETRQLRYVSFPFQMTDEDSAQAEEQIGNAYRQLEAGESFNMTMLDFSNLIPETTSGYVERSRLDARTDSVVKALKPGSYSPPYLAEYGWQIIMLDSATAESVALRRILVRPQTGAEAVAAVRDRVREFVTQAEHDGFDSVALRMGLSAMRARPIVDRKPNLAGLDVISPNQLMDWALSARQGDLMKEPVRGNRGFHVFELVELKPAGTQTFEEAKEAASWRARQAKEKKTWQELAATALAELRAGKTLEDLAKQNPGIEIATEQFEGLLDARRKKGAEFAGAVLALEPGQRTGVVTTNWGAFILRCDGLETTGLTTTSQYYQQRTQQAAQERIQQFLKKPEVKDYRDPFSW